MRLAFIGGGTMAEAILGGMLDAGLAAPADIAIGEPVARRREYLADKYGVAVHDDNRQVIQSADLVALAVKPQDLPTVFDSLGGQLTAGQSALSIIAGAKMSTLAQGLMHNAIIRVMPNTPAQIGCGMTMWTCADSVPSAHRELTRQMLSTVGQEIYAAEEKYLDMATALSASGPAYVFLFVEALIDAGVYVGLPRDTARALALQTVYGSVKLVMDSGQHPGQLKDMVVSPGGTTAEGLQALERGGVPAAVVDAVKAAYEKSLKLGQG